MREAGATATNRLEHDAREVRACGAVEVWARVRRAVAFTLVAWAILNGASQVWAQPAPERLRDDCATVGPPAIEAVCGDAALALQSLHGGVGLLMTAGGSVPASPSTAGHRMESTPRLVFDAGATWVSFRNPVFGASDATASDRRSLVVGGRLTAVAGIFHGFRPAPTVGGVLALDAVGTVELVRVPDSPASSPARWGWGAGVRLGIFRESFSLPGVTLSTMYYRSGQLTYGNEEIGGLAVLEPSVTSFRLIVGKDLWPVGLSSGIGLDRYRGRGRIEARVPDGGGTAASASGFRDLRMNRHYLFAGLNYTWLITQVTAEVTWARKPSPLAELEGTGPFRPGDRELQGVFGFRLIY